MANFNKKAIVLFNKAQSVEGTGVTPVTTDAIAITAAEYKDTISMQTEEFAGDELSRDEFSYQTDWYSSITGNIFLPAKGTTVLATIADFKPGPTLSACGLVPSLTGTTSSDQVVLLSNATNSTTFLTSQIRLASPDVATDYLCNVTDAQGMVDLDLAVGGKAKMKLTLMGDYVQPTMVTKVVPAFGTQKALAILAPLWTDANTVCCELTGTTSAYTTHTGDAGTVKNICVNKIAGANISGFNLTRELNSCNSRFSKEAQASEITLTVKLDSATATGSESATIYDPHNHMGDTHQFTLKYGNVTNGYHTFNFTALTLVDFSFTTVGTTRYLDLKFRNTGTTNIKLSQA